MTKLPDFSSLAVTPRNHFRLLFFAAAIQLAARLETGADGTAAPTAFLQRYLDEAGASGLDMLALAGLASNWLANCQAWAGDAELPLNRLIRAAALSPAALMALFMAGLPEEDSRFGDLYAELQGGAREPSPGLLAALAEADVADSRASIAANNLADNMADACADSADTQIRQLLDIGLLQTLNPETARGNWRLRVPAVLWDALSGSVGKLPAGLRHTPAWAAPRLDQLALPDALQSGLEILPALLRSGAASTLILRGPHHNGRATLLRALAGEMGMGTLEIAPGLLADGLLPQIGLLASLLGALPLFRPEPAPGEAWRLPELPGWDGPLGIVLGRQGGIQGPGAERALTLRLAWPDEWARRQLWLAQLPELHGAALTDALRLRLTSGRLVAAASLARLQAALAGHEVPTAADLRAACRNLGSEALEPMAQPVTADGDWRHLVLPEHVVEELRALVARCRHRERLREMAGAAIRDGLSAGVRALFKGASGTGKTLAAGVLAAELGLPLYRVDLAAVVNKYIGETEKNLARLFDRAEELDVILLFDEGDALLAKRTEVTSAHDRYANLETNYLLQRLEGYQGIVLIATNLGENIDSAFLRRMDLVVEFPRPESEARLAIWRLHLPERHRVEADFLREVAQRCVLAGGQIRNAALHAGLLALEAGGELTRQHLDAAIRREYRKSGAVCPLRGSPEARP